MNDLPYQVLFLASVVLQNSIQNSWEHISDDVESLANLIIKIINENSKIADESHISKLILILCDIFLLKFDLFSLISEIDQNLYPKLFSNLYEIVNTKEPFLTKWGVFSLSQNNLKTQFENCLEILEKIDPDSDWLELHYQLLYFIRDFNYYNSDYNDFSQDFKYFLPFLEKVQIAATENAYSDDLLKLFQYILKTEMSDSSSEDQFYFASIIEIVISLSNAMIDSENMNDENNYEYVIYLWDSVFIIPDFFVECDHFDLLDEIVTEYMKSLPQLVRHSSAFTDSLNNFADFLCTNRESESLTPFIVSYLDFLSALVNSDDDFFKDIPIKNVFENIQIGFEECLSNYIVSIVEQNQSQTQLPESFFIILASTEPGFSKFFGEFASTSLIQIMKEKPPSISPGTAIFFIRKTGVFVENEEIVSNLISIVFELFDKEANGAAKAVKKSLAVVPNILCNFASQIMSISSSGKLKINESCSLVVSLYMLLPSLINQSESNKSCSPDECLSFINSFIEHYLKEIASLFESKSANAIDSLQDSLYFITELLGHSPSEVPADFKSSLFETVTTSLNPLLMIEDDNVQDDFCKLFRLFFKLNFISNREQQGFVAEWLERIVPDHPNECYFNIIKFVIGDFEVSSIMQFVISFIENQVQNQKEGEINVDETKLEAKIVKNVIRKLFLKNKEVFWATFSEQFLVSLLTRNPNIIALNHSLDLFEKIFDPEYSNKVDADFAVLTLRTLFNSMIIFYYPKQIKCVLEIIHLIIKNSFLPYENVISIFLEFFDRRIEGVDDLISRFSSQKVDDDLLKEEFDLISSAIDFIRKQEQ